MPTFDVIIIGAGAAGLMCAAQAHTRGRRVLVLESAPKVAQKIRISGGGRANFTNLHTTPAHYLSDNPRFCVSALARYTPQDFIGMVERHGIAYHEKAHGQLFCDGSAQQIIDMLMDEARGATVKTGVTVSRVGKRDEGFTVDTDQGPFSADALVIATGGPSIPKMGATRFAYTVAEQFGLNVIEPRPGLVPLTFDAATLENLEGLSGVSVDACVKRGSVQFTDALLFTHRGLSGPAILQVSSYWRAGEALTIDLLPGVDLLDHLKEAKAGHPTSEPQTILAHHLPKRLARTLGGVERRERPFGRGARQILAALGGPSGGLAHQAGGVGRLSHRGSHGGWRRHEGIVVENHGGKLRSRIVFHWRSGGCDGAFGRVQFSMGLGVGPCLRAMCVRSGHDGRHEYSASDCASFSGRARRCGHAIDRRRVRRCDAHRLESR